jgi:hypothetical protein
LRSPREASEFEGRSAGGAVEGADEIGEVGKADVIGDIGDRTVVVGEPPCRMSQPRAHQVLVRCHAEHFGKQPQEMERADPGLGGGVVQGDRLVRMGIDPQRGFHRATAVARRVGASLARPTGHHLDKAARQHLADFVEPDIAAAICCRLR